MKCSHRSAFMIVILFLLGTTLVLTQTKGFLFRQYQQSSNLSDSNSNSYGHRLLNLTNFQFIHNPKNFCSIQPSELGQGLVLTVVTSHPSNFLRRQSIRQTLGTIKRAHGWNHRVIFMLGETSTKTSPQDLGANDLVIGNFIESYRNLNYKHVMSYKWVSEHCPAADCILKIDDDVLVNIFKVFEYVRTLSGKSEGQIICNKMQGYGPERTGKNPVSIPEWPLTKYPTYCSGMAYLIERRALQRILEVQTLGRFLWIDDVFVTGILREMVNVTIFGINHEYFLHDVPSKVNSFIGWFNDPSPPRELEWAFSLLDFPELDVEFHKKVIYSWHKLMAYRLTTMLELHPPEVTIV